MAGLGLALFGALVLAGSFVPLALPPWLVVLSAFGLALPPTLWAVARVLRPLHRTILGLSDGIRSFHDGDFGTRVTSERTDELGELVRLYNRVADTLQSERSALRQRELLLQTALDQSPVAIVLVNPLDRIVYANAEARSLLGGGTRLAGLSFAELLASCPPEMREVLDSGTDGIFTVAHDGESETYHLARRGFFLNRLPHGLYLLRRMTAELGRQEAEIWKRVIRIVSHELNNSLAPIASLARSAVVAAERPDAAERLASIYASIRERVDHLGRFLEGYARFARLPRPVKETVSWAEWLEATRKLYPFELEGTPPASGRFDPSQLQQVLINLLKNAVEASDGEPRVTVRVDRTPDGGTLVSVLDRGRGMSGEVLRQALLPFYTTKPSGAGVGLPLCREIVEAHGGRLRIQSRRDGGTAVRFWIP